MEKIALIPAYKPDAKMIDLVFALHGNGFSVVIVDDGSGTEFEERFKKAEQYARIVRCAQNGGKGIALKRGLEYISANFAPPYCVITADADGQHRVEDIVKVAALSQRSPGALVIGSRSLKNMPAKNWWGNMYTRLAFFFSTGRYVHDSQTGLRGFSHTAVPFMLDVPGTRYEYEMNVLLQWAGCNLPVKEQPIETVYFDGNKGSHFQAFRDSVRIYREILRFSAPSFFCFVLDVLLFSLLFYTAPVRPALIVANVCAGVTAAAAQYALIWYGLKKHYSLKEISFVKYVLWSAVLVAANTLALWGLTASGVAPVGAKILACIIIFFAVFVPNRLIIFKDKRS